MNKILVFCLLVMSISCHAKQESIDITVDRLYLGLALGAGTMTNPLNGEDNFPLVVIPDIAIYGKHFYFDNGQLGLTISENQRHVISLITEFNPENRFFVGWHPANIFVRSQTDAKSFSKTTVLASQVNEPDWALDAGVNYQYMSQTWRFSANVYTDITDVHGGERVTFSIVKGVQINDGLLSFNVGIDYLSQQLADYYYGIQVNDNVGGVYKQESAWLPRLEINWHMPINKKFGFLTKLKYHSYEQLSDSPLFDDNHALSLFAGVTYVF